MYHTPDLNSISTLGEESGNELGCKSKSIIDLSNFLINEVEYRDFSNTFKSFTIISNKTSGENFKSEEQKSIKEKCYVDKDDVLQSKHSDIDLEEIIKKDVNISPWLRFGIEKDPWKDCKLHCLPKLLSMQNNADHILKPDQILANAKNLKQSPDKKYFAHTKLELNNKGLKDIGFLSTYRCFQFIDLSWNQLENLEPLNDMVYLMHLDASHNSLKTAICMDAPWYLTYINLSYNDISIIEDLSKFWSLQNMNFSHNKIGRIQGLQSLKYLRSLDLSHNHIKCLENLGNLPLIYLNLESNEISEWKETDKEGVRELNSESYETLEWEESGKEGAKEVATDSNEISSEWKETREKGVIINQGIKVINLNNNLIQSMELFKDLPLLEELNLGNNKICGFDELDNLKNKKMLKHLTMSGNEISSINSYRILLLHYAPSIDSIDGDAVTIEEKKIVHKLLNNYAAENKYELRARLLFYEQLARVECTIPGIIPMKDTCLPLIVLVGPFGSGRSQLIEKLIRNHDQKLYYAKNHICKPEEMTNLKGIHDKFISRSQFNSMMINGEFLATSSFIGVEFGLSKLEYNKGIGTGKMTISSCDLTMAFCLQALGVNIQMILCITDNKELNSQRIESKCKDLKQEGEKMQPSITTLSYKLLMECWQSSGNINGETEMRSQEEIFSASTQKQSLNDPHEKTENNDPSCQIETEKENTVIHFIEQKIEEIRESYEEIKSCDSFIRTVYTDNLDEAYESLKNILRDTSELTSGVCSLDAENFYETLINHQRKAIIEELNRREQEI